MKATLAGVMATCNEQVAGAVAKCGRWNSHMRVAYFILNSCSMVTDNGLYVCFCHESKEYLIW